MSSLSKEEQALWAKVVETVEPLSREPGETPKLPPTRKVAPPDTTPGQRQRAKAAQERKRPVIVKAQPKRHADKTLDGGWDRRLASGKMSPDRVIDLHGHRLDDAWEAIDLGLESAISDGARLILLITGHAPKGEPPVKRGRIRAAVDDWLAASRHAGRIAAVRPASPRHGGRGALYVVLRRAR
ncbi:Smr/MutS family protein [Sphingomicrobium sediminis]|uniref:Smr/MutS family protein n=1 Tax=Sphingomicrobium sediminis TaxID=2950949 RepID=A0A9X2EKK6_9SPHN|nr:Smr/MutS family protein [Sphingomicrobium sediminis]MCM8557069.1 Smr/MutS family protein [Sphingomicrobium sediminis]